ncbi:uncharacterized protein LAESUDRAFT_764461 [Laetiporus sulphureus 93-53]|uniref:CCHC-type domain-containing protein n=1 Tax=Laetiporus sulphureus 93-53 TaxID=1314785 RepID=A0A165BAN5_9APHY|nr:uncharacterized protein LAESUDRAFT_764461 [Laetiporus sulphureus 93-53]KZT00628.1 hypothetical protein LAESUDRAFT_764461 [Laetiporus sulphureus 93-53]
MSEEVFTSFNETLRRLQEYQRTGFECTDKGREYLADYDLREHFPATAANSRTASLAPSNSRPSSPLSPVPSNVSSIHLPSSIASGPSLGLDDFIPEGHSLLDEIQEAEAHIQSLPPTHHTQYTMAATITTVSQMPFRGDRAAPTFDPEHPRMLLRFFDNLEILFARCNITDETERKCWVCRYLTIDVADLIESLEEYSDVQRTFQDLKVAVQRLYPGADMERKWELKQPDHYPDDSYDVNEIYEAAKFVLHGTSPSPAVTGSSKVKSESGPAIKTEDISLLIESLVKSVQTLTAAVTGVVPKGNGIQASAAPKPTMSSGGNGMGYCHYCGEAGGMIGTCKHIEEDIKSGKCMRNSAGKVVLPNGFFVPCNIPGIIIHDQIYEWHRRNQSTVQTQASISAASLFEVSPEEHSTFALGDDDRIRALEQELYSLRKTKQVFDGVYMPPRKSNTNTRQSPPTSVSQPVTQTQPTMSTVPTAASSTTPSTSQPTATTPEADKEPEHPYFKFSLVEDMDDPSDSLALVIKANAQLQPEIVAYTQIIPSDPTAIPVRYLQASKQFVQALDLLYCQDSPRISTLQASHIQALISTLSLDTPTSANHRESGKPPSAGFAATKKKYKPVALKTRPVLTTVPESFRIIRSITGDPLAMLPQLPMHPPQFTPTGRYSLERMMALNQAHSGGFLWSDE